MSCGLPHAPHSTLPATWPDPIWRLPNTHVSPPCFYIEGSQLNTDYGVKNVPRNYFDIRFSTPDRRLIATLLFFLWIFPQTKKQKLSKPLTLVTVCIWETPLATLARFSRFSSSCRETPGQHVKLCHNGSPPPHILARSLFRNYCSIRSCILNVTYRTAKWTTTKQLNVYMRCFHHLGEYYTHTHTKETRKRRIFYEKVLFSQRLNRRRI